EQLRHSLLRLGPGYLQVRMDRVEQLGLDPEYRVERVHRALEDDRDLPPAHPAQLGVIHREQVDRVAARGDPAAAVADAAAGDQGRRAEQAGGAVGEGGLARAALAAQADHFPGVQAEAYPLDRAHVAAWRAVGDGQVADLQDR